MIAHTLLVGLLVSFFTAFTAVESYGITFPVSSTATYLRTDDTDTPGAPLIINLVSLGLSPGNTILIDELGDFAFNATFADVFTDMIGVFSSSATVLSKENPHRVPGAIDAGVDFVTAPTLLGGFTTDISEDFRIDPEVNITIPTGAQFLIVGVSDIFWGDNVDPDSDLAVSVPSAAVPEPASVALLLSGAAGVAAWRRLSRCSRRRDH